MLDLISLSYYAAVGLKGPHDPVTLFAMKAEAKSVQCDSIVMDLGAVSVKNTSTIIIYDLPVPSPAAAGGTTAS